MSSRLIRALWPLALWMGFVFVMSTEVGSPDHTSRFLIPILHWIDPTMTAIGFERVHHLVRKAAHVFEYALLAVFLLRAFRIMAGVALSRWSWRWAFLALTASAAYAATDEFHQLFVQSRGPSFRDVLIDTCGALLGLTIAFLGRSAFRAKESE